MQKQGITPGAVRRYAPADGSFDCGKNRGGSMSICGRVCTSLMRIARIAVAKLQAARVPIA